MRARTQRNKVGPGTRNRLNMLSVVLLSAHLLLLLSEIPRAQSVGTPVTCEAGNYTEGESASVTCHFHTSVQASQRSINVVHYATENAKPKDILLCSWSPQDQRHECTIEDANYTFDGNLTDRVKLAIPSVSAEHTGQYLCFFLPPDDIHPEVCRLRVQAKQERSSTGESEESQDTVPVIVGCVVGILGAVMIIVVIFVVLLRRRRTKRTADGREPPLGDETTNPMLEMKENKVDEILRTLTLSDKNLQEMMKVLNEAMMKGLQESTRIESGIGMFPAFISISPDFSDTREVLVVVINNLHIQAMVVSLQGQDATVTKRHKVSIMEKGRLATVEELFELVADELNNFLWSHEVPSKILPVALIMAFPCDQQSVEDGRVVKWTKEVSYRSGGNQGLKKLFRDSVETIMKRNALAPRKVFTIRKLEVTAVVNDTVSALLSVAVKKPNCKIGLTVDSGLNACYTEDWTHEDSEDPEAEKPPEMVINTELGALGENGCLEFCRTQYDRELDEQSTSPGSQILEKMVGGLYMGEIVRLILVRLYAEGQLFQSADVECAFFEKNRFAIDYVAQIEEDTEEPFSKTAEVLMSLGLTRCTAEDLHTVQKVCRAVCQRAAFLAAASLAVLINHINQPNVGVVIDGNIFRSFPGFKDMVNTKTRKLVKPELNFHLISPSDEGFYGAARVAASTMRARDAGLPETSNRGGLVYRWMRKLSENW